MFLRLFKHLLPRGRAWLLTIDSSLRLFFEGLAGTPTDVVKYFDDVFDDMFPQLTRDLNSWEDMFGLPNTGLTEQQRRDRLAAAWAAQGGQDPRYIQDTLRGAGFDVYVHEWWIPGTEPAPGVKVCTVPRNPSLVLSSSSNALQAGAQAGEPLAQAGEALMQAGNVSTTQGYPLVNKIRTTLLQTSVQAGEPLAQAGEPLAQAGEGFAVQTQKEYTLPTDPLKWPYFLYIGGAVFPATATVPVARRSEFENLCIKICPGQQWLGILVLYV